MTGKRCSFQPLRWAICTPAQDEFHKIPPYKISTSATEPIGRIAIGRDRMIVQRLTPADAAVARDVVRLHKSRQVSEAYMRRFLADERNYLLAAFMEEQAVGFL